VGIFAPLGLVVLGAMAGAHFHDWAKSPPMGCNSWDCFGTGVTEDQVLENAVYMSQHLKKHGWNLVTVDIDWFLPHAKGWNYVPNAELTLDDFGRPMPAVDRFPSASDGRGFSSLASKVHKMGLKFGVHLLRGIPRKAVSRGLTIFGANIKAVSVANQADTCPWNPDMFGVDVSKPGGQEYYDSLFKQLATWGVDFVKVDDLSRPYHQPEIEAIRKAIDRCGRPMVFSTSPGATPVLNGKHVADHANTWRISDDFWDSWKALEEQFERLDYWTPFRGPGHWPDADMLPLGAVRQGERDDWTHFTPIEQQTMMTLWCIAKSPLILGGHLPKNDQATLDLIINDEVLSVNQFSTENHQVSRTAFQCIWSARDPKAGDRYIAVFNLTDSPRRIQTPLEKSGRLRDLWGQKDMGSQHDQIDVELPAHGSALYRIH
jgi:alpha-galactosidase